MTIRELLHHAGARLKKAGCDTPRLDAELLLMHVWKLSRTDLIVRADDIVPESIAAEFDTLLQRRMHREPLAYITGGKEFWSRSFHVTPDVLIPRPETEHLIEAVLTYFPNRNGNYRFCDIGTGSGCIAVTLACEYPRSRIIATDISGTALEVARHNAETHRCSDRIIFRRGNMLEALQQTDAPFDSIISNPPYVAKSEMAELEKELSREPRHALTDERDGLGYLTEILHNAPASLQADGHIILETGLCGLPPTPDNLVLKQHIHDLAGHLRGGIYQLACTLKQT